MNEIPDRRSVLFVIESSFNKDMLILLREANGSTQKEMADLLGLRQSRLSQIETGDVRPHTHDVEWYSKRLKVEPAFFYQKGEARSSGVSFYRKKITLPSKMLIQCNAQVQLNRLKIEQQIGEINLGNPGLLPLLVPDENGGPKEVARKIRKLWEIPAGPVRNLTKLVENAGCVVVNYPFPSEKMDGLCIRSARNKAPIIFLNESFPKSRRRLSLAHELAHLIMHTHLHGKVEDEAWEFATEFLMPSEEIGTQLSSLDIAILGKLKCHWGVSMAAILKQGQILGKIDEKRERALWIQLAKCGYRKSEPFEEMIPDENPTPLENRLKPP